MEEFEISFPESALGGVFIVDERFVNMEDLARARPGSVIRTRDVDAIRFIPPQVFEADFIAGMISDEA